MGRKKGRRTGKAPLPDLPIAAFADSSEGVRPGLRKSHCLDMKEAARSAAAEEVPEDWEEREEAGEPGGKGRVLAIGDRAERTVAWRPGGRHYTLLPGDFWHLLGGYIQPEQVGQFALLCRASHAVTCGQAFWRRLYLRHCLAPGLQELLPGRLQAATLLHRPRGLRACTVLALHRLHLPLQAARRRAGGMWPDPHILIGHSCSLHWSQRVAQKQVVFYFKLRGAGQELPLRPRTERDLPDTDQLLEGEEEDEGGLLAELSDTRHNPEEGCRVLQVSAAAWTRLPPVMGLQLRGVGLSVSGVGMRYHKLSLEFGTELRTTHLVLEPVTSLKVVPWWDPAYPAEGEGATQRQPALTADHWDA